ncbi:TetR/AcrR family transcriptional regulator [Novosphingobium lindaniclasticum]
MSNSPARGAARRDAQHNRAHILDVARAAFDRDGIDVSMDAIAKMAGFGAGTLYRNFENKDALLAALLDRHYEGLEERRLEIEAAEQDEAQALERWIEALGDWMLAYEGLPEPLRAACRSESPLTRTCHAVIATTERILKAAQEKGLARTHVTGRDLFLGALAIAWAGGDRTAGEDTTKVLRTVLKSGWQENAAS